MRKDITYVCERCGNIGLRKKSAWRTAKRVMRSTLFGLILIFAIVGVLGIYNVFVGEAYDSPDLMFSVGGLNSGIRNFLSIFQSSSYFDEIAKNITKDCPYAVGTNNQDPECQIKEVYIYLEKNFKYVEGTEVDPIKIWEQKHCDCDECSALQNAILKSLGITARLQCSQNHCWSIISLNGKKIKADLTMHEWKEYK